MGFDLISRFRDDAALFYPTLLRNQRAKEGRPKLYDGKIDMANLDTSRAAKIANDNGDLYTLMAYSKSLSRWSDLSSGIPKMGKPKVLFLYRS